MMPDDFFKKNMEMWEQYTSTYMDNMFKVMEKTMQQSQAFREQLDNAVEQTVSAQTEASMAMLKAIQAQLEALNEKIDQMVAEAETEKAE